MWQTAPSYYYEPRVRFAEPRYGRQVRAHSLPAATDDDTGSPTHQLTWSC